MVTLTHRRSLEGSPRCRGILKVKTVPGRALVLPCSDITSLSVPFLFNANNTEVDHLLPGAQTHTAFPFIACLQGNIDTSSIIFVFFQYFL